MITQAKAIELIEKMKESARHDVFSWEHGKRQEELFLAVGESALQFLVSLKRNPYEITAHLRTKGHNVGLARIDNAFQHTNPDGSIIRGPHMHWYREGEELAWAEQIEWYDVDKPFDTLSKFLELIHAKFTHGIQGMLV